MHHATVDGETTMGSGNEVHPYAYIGGRTQDKKLRGNVQCLDIGSDNIFREYVTVHCATAEDLLTKVGDHNLILAYSHIAHECQIGNHLTMSSHAAFGGHVIVGDHVNIGWGAGIHQFCRLGDYCMVGGISKIVQDVLPYVISDGNPGTGRTINKIGLERAGFSKDEITLIRRIFKVFYKKGLNHRQAIDFLKENEEAEHHIVKTVLNFAARSQRGFS